MPKTDSKIDSYIAKAQPFAKPILIHIRELLHKTCPDVEEKIKWSFPHFDYKGEMMCSMAAFKNHAVFGFWKAPLMKDKKLFVMAQSETAMGHSGKLTSVKDLPSDKVFTAYVKEAMKLNDEGKKLPSREKKPVEELPVPSYLLAAFKKNKQAETAFKNFAPSHRREYILWLTEAKTDDTRDKRLAQAIEWMAEGKPRNWKYMKK